MAAQHGPEKTLAEWRADMARDPNTSYWHGRVTYTVRGTLAGAIWWPIGERATKTFEYRTTDRPDSMRELVESVLGAEDGDFSDAPRFLDDSVLTITRWRSDGRGHVSRSFYLSSFRSLADYVLPDELPAYVEVVR